MDAIFLQLLSEADCLQIDGHCFNQFELQPVLDCNDLETVVLDLSNEKSDTPSAQFTFTFGDLLEAKYDDQKYGWKCGDHLISLSAKDIAGLHTAQLQSIEEVSSTPALDRYQIQNSAIRVNSYYFPRPQAFARAKTEALKNLKSSVEQLESLTEEQFFTERRRGLN